MFNPFARYERVKPGESENPDDSKQVISEEDMRRGQLMAVIGGVLLLLEFISIIILIVLKIKQYA